MIDVRHMPPARHVISVMLVDDHKTMLWGLERLIGGEHSGMRVVATASDGTEALEQAKALQPDVIVLDLDLGGISSLAILPALAQCGGTRVLVLTASHDQAILDQTVLKGARGFVEYINKAKSVLHPTIFQATGERLSDQDSSIW